MEVFYTSIPASDGVSAPAVDAVFEVFELADTSYTTPLPILNAARLPLPQLRTTEQGVVPSVYVVSNSLSHNFKSGAWVWRRDSFDGAAQSVETSRDAAMAAAADAARSAQAVEEGTLPPGGTAGQALVKLSSANGHAGWQNQSGGGGDGTINAAPAGSVFTRIYSGTAYPARGSSRGDIIVRWRGPIPPTIGGSFAVDGVDEWVNTLP